MAVAARFGAWSDFVSPVCRTHYGGILIAVGRWPEAEEQLLAALRTFESSYRAHDARRRWPSSPTCASGRVGSMRRGA